MFVRVSTGVIHPKLRRRRSVELGNLFFGESLLFEALTSHKAPKRHKASQCSAKGRYIDPRSADARATSDDWTAKGRQGIAKRERRSSLELTSTVGSSRCARQCDDDERGLERYAACEVSRAGEQKRIDQAKRHSSYRTQGSTSRTSWSITWFCIRIMQFVLPYIKIERLE